MDESSSTLDSVKVQHDASLRGLLLYDGVCVLCDHTVNFVLRHEAGPRLQFAPLGGSTAAAIFERHPDLRTIDSIVLIEGPESAEQVWVRSDAAIRLGKYLTGKWQFVHWLRLVPRPIRNVVYDAVAHYRYRTFGRLDACKLAPPELRDRFLP